MSRNSVTMGQWLWGEDGSKSKGTSVCEGCDNLALFQVSVCPRNKYSKEGVSFSYLRDRTGEPSRFTMREGEEEKDARWGRCAVLYQVQSCDSRQVFWRWGTPFLLYLFILYVIIGRWVYGCMDVYHGAHVVVRE